MEIVLLNWRKLADLSIAEAAEKIGIKSHTLRRIERGRGADLETFMTIVNWLRKPIQ